MHCTSSLHLASLHLASSLPPCPPPRPWLPFSVLSCSLILSSPDRSPALSFSPHSLPHRTCLNRVPRLTRKGLAGQIGTTPGPTTATTLRLSTGTTRRHSSRPLNRRPLPAAKQTWTGLQAEGGGAGRRQARRDHCGRWPIVPRCGGRARSWTVRARAGCATGKIAGAATGVMRARQTRMCA